MGRAAIPSKPALGPPPLPVRSCGCPAHTQSYNATILPGQTNPHVCLRFHVICIPSPMVSPQNTHGTSLRQAKGMQLWQLRGTSHLSPDTWHFSSDACSRRGDTLRATGAETLCVQLARRHFASVAETLLICRGDTAGCRGDASHLSRRHFSSVAETPLSCRGDAWNGAETPPSCRGDVPVGSGVAETALGDHDRRGDMMFGSMLSRRRASQLGCRGDGLSCRGDTAAAQLSRRRPCCRGAARQAAANLGGCSETVCRLGGSTHF
jgi:hypothetical protein